MITITMPEWFAYLVSIGIAANVLENGLKLYAFCLKRKNKSLSNSG